MTKFGAFTLGAAVAAAVASALITRDQSEIGRLRTAMSSLQQERDRLSDFAVENAHLQTAPQTLPINEPAREVLRLRREVGRLRLDVESLRQERGDKSQSLQEDPKLSLVSDGVLRSFGIEPKPFDEVYRGMGVDTNSVPSIGMGVTPNQLLAELRRVGANVLADEKDFVQAEVFPTALASDDRDLPAMKMSFYFESGRLTSRRVTLEVAASHQ
jgi:hypothetical protein